MFYFLEHLRCAFSELYVSLRRWVGPYLCSDRAAGEHQCKTDWLEFSEGDLAAGRGCSDVPGQSPGDR